MSAPSSAFLFFFILISCTIISCKADQDEASLEKGSVLFEDFFSDIDGSRWATSQQSSDTDTGSTDTNLTGSIVTHVITDNLSCFIPNRVDGSLGKLRLSVKSQTLTCHDTNTAYEFGGGEIQSASTFTSGRFQVNLQASLSNGVMSSFFLYGNAREIGFHLPGNDPTKVFLSYRKDSTAEIIALRPDNFNAANQYHSYSILWEDDLIQWSIDGKAVLGIKKNVPDAPMTLVLSTWITGDRTQADFPASELERYTDYTYVRVETFP
ncbi:MAG: family 16 glycosylhydrolase [SAR324 cluster bacterium]|nr:family 16 glycosylhydrolase [SAR324 cluster bacterium]